MPQELDDVEEPNGLAEEDLDELEDDEDLIEDEEVALVDEDDDDVVVKVEPDEDVADVVDAPVAPRRRLRPTTKRLTTKRSPKTRMSKPAWT